MYKHSQSRVIPTPNELYCNLWQVATLTTTQDKRFLVDSLYQMATSPKKSKLCSGKRFCSFRAEWLNDKEFSDWLVKSDDSFSAFCKVCTINFTIKHNGVKAVRSHMFTEKHKLSAKSVKCHSKATNFFTKDNSAEQDQVTAVEVSLAFHGVMHHHSYVSMDCGAKLLAECIPDSKVVKKIHCGRTKCSAIVENILSPHSVDSRLTEIGNTKYSLSTDASNKGAAKHFPITLRYFSATHGVSEMILDFYEDSKETSVAIADRIQKVIEENGLSIENMVAYGADSAAVNYGRHHSVFIHLQKQQPNLYKARCNCHIVHNAAKFGFKLMDYDVETLVLKVYSEFASSAKHVDNLQHFCEEAELDYQKVLRHVPTRWLSLFDAVDRLVRNWPAIKAYFSNQGEHEVHSAIWKFVSSVSYHDESESKDEPVSIAECYLFFTHNVLQLFTRTIKQLESTSITAIEAYRVMVSLREKIQQRKADHFFGYMANQGLRRLSSAEIASFTETADSVYTRSLQYLEKWVNFEDNSLIIPFSILLLDEPFPFEKLVDAMEAAKLRFDGDDLYEEFCNLRDFLSAYKPGEQDCVSEKWKSFFSSFPQCTQLLHLVQVVLAIPASNAFVERIFSTMHNVWSDERNRLRTELVKAELCVRYNYRQTCRSFYQFILGEKKLLESVRKSLKYRHHRGK